MTHPVQAPDALLADHANLRDLGGFATADGSARVRRGIVYRSAMPRSDNPAMLEALEALAISAVIDLRSERERSGIPPFWERVGCSDYTCHMAPSHGGDLGRMWIDAIDNGAEAVRETMAGQYRNFPRSHAAAYGTLFDRLAQGHTPVLFHCTVGKDRTGVAAALVLAALGVSREDIARDYLITNGFDQSRIAWAGGKAPGQGEMDAARKAALEALMLSDTEYLDALFDELERSYGGLEGYLGTVLDVDGAKLAALRENLLESTS